MDHRNIFSINQSRHDDLSSMPSSPWPMRCDERGVDNSECPSVSVLYHYPSQNRSKPSKKRNPLSCIHGAWWSFAPLSNCAVGCGFDWLTASAKGWAPSTPKWNQLNSGLSFSIFATNNRLKRLELLTSAYWGCLCLPKGANKEPKPQEAHWGGITKSHSDQLFAKCHRETKKIEPNLPHC